MHSADSLWRSNLKRINYKGILKSGLIQGFPNVLGQSFHCETSTKSQESLGYFNNARLEKFIKNSN